MAPPRRKPLDEGFAEIVASAPAAAKPAPAPSAAPVATLQDDNAVTLQSGKRKTTSHASIYVSRGVVRAVKQLALDHDVKAHDIYIEGLRHVLAKHGLDFDALNAE